MGSIVYIDHNPKKWKVIRDDLKLKETGETLLQVEIGDIDDYPQGCIELVQYIRKSVYDKLISGEYTVKSGRIIRLEITDKEGKDVKPYFEDGSMIY